MNKKYLCITKLISSKIREKSKVNGYKSADRIIHKFAFTLAEVLITMVVIGIVATIALPPIINDIKDKEYAIARKRVLQTLGETCRLMAVNGTIRDASNAEDFVENYLKKQLRIMKTCSNDNLKACGIVTDENGIFDVTESRTTMPTDISQLADNISNSSYAPTMANIDKASYGFVMSNGYSINLFYNPNCIQNNTDRNHYAQNMVCVNALYDINGLGKPNQVGKDIGFVTVIYPDIQSIAVAPDVASSDLYSGNINSNYSNGCKKYSKEYNSVPNRDELLAMYYNNKLLNIATDKFVGSSSGWLMSFSSGSRAKMGNIQGYFRCIRR